MRVNTSPTSSPFNWARVKEHIWPVAAMAVAAWLWSLMFMGGWPMTYQAQAVLRLRSSDERVGALNAERVAGALREDGSLNQAARTAGMHESAQDIRERLEISAMTDDAGDVLVQARFAADTPEIAQAFVASLSEGCGQRLERATIARVQQEHVAARQAAAAALAEKRKAEQDLQQFLEEHAASKVARAPQGFRPLAAWRSVPNTIQLVSAEIDGPPLPIAPPPAAQHATYFAPASNAIPQASLLNDPALVGDGRVTLAETPVNSPRVDRRQIETEYADLSRRKSRMTEQHPYYGQVVARLVQLENLLAATPAEPQLLAPPTPQVNEFYVPPGHGDAAPAANPPVRDAPAVAWSAEVLQVYRQHMDEVKLLDEQYQDSLAKEQQAFGRQQEAEAMQVFQMEPAKTSVQLDPRRKSGWLLTALMMASGMGVMCVWVRRRALETIVTAKDAADFLPAPVLGTLRGASSGRNSFVRAVRMANEWMRPAGEISILAAVVWLLGLGMMDAEYLQALADDPLRGVAMCWGSTFGTLA